MFQTLDTKNNCHAVYENGVFHFEEYKPQGSETWAFHQAANKENLKIAQIWAGGASLKECCPADLMQDYAEIEKKLQSFNLAFNAVDFNVEEWCVYDFNSIRLITCNCKYSF